MFTWLVNGSIINPVCKHCSQSSIQSVNQSVQSVKISINHYSKKISTVNQSVTQYSQLTNYPVSQSTQLINPVRQSISTISQSTYPVSQSISTSSQSTNPVNQSISQSPNTVHHSPVHPSTTTATGSHSSCTRPTHSRDVAGSRARPDVFRAYQPRDHLTLRCPEINWELLEIATKILLIHRYQPHHYENITGTRILRVYYNKKGTGTKQVLYSGYENRTGTSISRVLVYIVLE